MFDLKGKNVLVTGAARGIGRGIAKALLLSNASVMLADLDGKECRKTAAELSRAGKTASMKCNVCDREEVERAVNECVRKFGSVDILVNNAGIYPYMPFLEMSEPEWGKVMEVNLKGVFNCSQAASRKMAKQGKGGKIISIASIAGIVAFPGLVHYCTTKAGIIGFTRSLALELAQYKINVNAIGPGAIDTPGASASLSDPKQREAFSKQIPWKRIGKPEDIAAGVVFLSSREAEYITGQTLFIDGGWTIQ